eukprot:1028156-Pleurochrysis_carterae.AAC.2
MKRGAKAQRLAGIAAIASQTLEAAQKDERRCVEAREAAAAAYESAKEAASLTAAPASKRQRVDEPAGDGDLVGVSAKDETDATQLCKIGLRDYQQTWSFCWLLLL